MPLVHGYSDKAFKKNVSTEMSENPENRAQNLAIAYAVQRKAKREKEGYASGGTVKHAARMWGQQSNKLQHNRYAEGGEVEAEEGEGKCECCGMEIPECECIGGEEDIVARIMAKHFAEGGMVDEEENEDLADFEPNAFEVEDEMVAPEPDEEYPEDEREDEDERDIILRIMKSRALKDRMPRTA